MTETNQKSNDSKFTDRMQELAEFFRSTDTEPICIDPNESKSINKGIAEVDERIRDVVKGEDGNDGQV